MSARLTIGSLFSGIGGLELGLERAGLGPVLWQCEIDPFCRAVLAKHWPHVTRFVDVTQPRVYPHVDLICGGFPCQDVSAAGRGRGLGGARSGLWFHFASVVAAVAPAWVVVENVASGARRWLPTVRRGLHVLGYRTRALGIGAVDVGAPHRRQRVFVVAHSDDVAKGQQGRSCRSRRRLEAVAALDGEQGALADADGAGQSREASGRIEGGNGVGDGGGAWAAEPGVGRVAHGVPRRLDRLKSLGNAVVPQCAEIVGRVIREQLT